MTRLEDRLLLCWAEHDDDGLVYAIEPTIMMPATSTGATPATASGAKHSLAALPALHSNPGASAKLYIAFAGAAPTTWGGRTVPATPAYDRDGDPSTFSDSELDAIREIFARVAEKYSPFNMDVTTEDPGQYADRKAQRVVVGGDGRWFGSAGGVSYVGAFYNSASNTSWVFSMNLANGNPKYTAEAVAHEAGHAFGLDHQSAYSSSGQKTDEYNPGDSKRAPIMGDSYDAARGVWWKGTSSVSSKSTQDDLSILAGSSNGFGYRSDSSDGTFASPRPLTVAGTGLAGSGIIITTDDVDVFSFSTGNGQVRLTGAVVNFGPTLDLKLQVYTASGRLVAMADTSSLGESLTLNLTAGSYLLAVSSHGGYGDVGQYTISGTIAPEEAITVAAPSGLSARTTGNAVSLAWTDNAGNENAYAVERSVDGITWTTLATLGANTVQYVDSAVTAGASYHYRVLARSGAVQSAYSGIAIVTIPSVPPTPSATVAAPSNLTVTRRDSTRVVVSWTDNSSNETGFQIEYSTDGGKTWRSLGRVGANTRSVQVYGIITNRTYSFRVKATGADGGSAYSNTATLNSGEAASKLAGNRRLALKVRKGTVRSGPRGVSDFADVFVEGIHQPPSHRPTLSGADHPTIDSRHGHDFGRRSGEKTLIRDVEVMALNGGLLADNAQASAQLEYHTARDAFENALGRAGREHAAVAHDEDVVAGAFRHVAHMVEHDRFGNAGIHCFDLGQDVVEVIKALDARGDGRGMVAHDRRCDD